MQFNLPSKGLILPSSFYLQKDVLLIAKKLLGKFLVTSIDGIVTSGMISETEAYAGETDRASHAYGGRRTGRTEVMYGEGGQAYVYLCYGIHSLFNVVTNKSGIPHAVLIRALIPAEGMEHMLKRRNKLKPDKSLCAGPGTLCKALGIDYSVTGAPLNGTGTIAIEDRGIIIPDHDIISGPRIGVDYAGADALLPYRFRIASNPDSK